MGFKFSDGKPYKVIALCMTSFGDDYQVGILKKLCHDCEKNNVRIMVFTSVTNLSEGGVNDIGEAQIYSSFDVNRFDAIVVMSETFKQDMVLNKLVGGALQSGVPVISVDREIDGCINIVFDYGASFEKIVRHIVEFHKVRTLNFIAGFRNNAFSDERIGCFRRVLEENGLEFDERRVLYGDFWSQPTRDAIEEFMASGLSMPDAFICANDVMAIECMRVLKGHGYKIPEDIIVTGYDGIELEKFYSPRLTTAEFDIDALGEAIFRSVHDSVEGQKTEDKIVISYRHRIGESCGCKAISTDNLEEELMKLKFDIDRRDQFVKDMYNMIARLCNYPLMHYVFSLLTEYLDPVLLKEMWMCFNSDALDRNMDVSFEFDRTKQDHSGYTDTMRVPVHVIGNRSQPEEDFEQSDMLPDIGRILDENPYIMFVPIHLQGVTMGYMANTFDIDSFRFNFYQTFILDFKNVIEMYVSRSATEQMYIRDMLTQIYNRHGFYRNIGEIMKRSRREEMPFTIISIDMDGLKQINDTYGHAEGDFALKKIAECMRTSTTMEEICSRFGGDEFIIAFCDSRGEERGSEIIEEMRGKLKEFNAYSQKPYYVNMSVGMYSKVAEKSDTLDLYIKCADALMYADKKENKKREYGLRNDA
ncbi:MAG: GGDEF domain-containing protein [Butyrivibrio sp.]|nr:GGDEF domain-containing protein [Butyrivibrio sp.]